jgi:hypothetical protein
VCEVKSVFKGALRVKFCSWSLFAVLLCASSLPAQVLSIGTANPLNTFTLGPDPTDSQVLNVRTSWSAKIPGHVSICIYMSGPLTGSPGNSATIAASSVRVNGSSIVTGNSNCGVPDAVQIARPVTSSGPGSRTDQLTILLASYSAALPPDTYTGALNLVATTQ